MDRISIQDLKGSLSAAVAAAEAGRTVLITRHNQPVAQLGPAAVAHVHHGTKVGTRRLVPALRRGTRGRALAILKDDRGNR
jgi:prevent-host-death family protein